MWKNPFNNELVYHPNGNQESLRYGLPWNTHLSIKRLNGFGGGIISRGNSSSASTFWKCHFHPCTTQHCASRIDISRHCARKLPGRNVVSPIYSINDYIKIDVRLSNVTERYIVSHRVSTININKWCMIRFVAWPLKLKLCHCKSCGRPWHPKIAVCEGLCIWHLPPVTKQNED